MKQHSLIEGLRESVECKNRKHIIIINGITSLLNFCNDELVWSIFLKVIKVI